MVAGDWDVLRQRMWESQYTHSVLQLGERRPQTFAGEAGAVDCQPCKPGLSRFKGETDSHTQPSLARNGGNGLPHAMGLPTLGCCEECVGPLGLGSYSNLAATRAGDSLASVPI